MPKDIVAQESGLGSGKQYVNDDGNNFSHRKTQAIVQYVIIYLIVSSSQ